MAAPITHIALTSKVYEDYFSNKDIAPFFVGTSFPDIRYLRVIEREKTHFPNIDLNSVKSEKDPFLAGMKFHMLVDQIREQFMVERGVYEVCPESKFASQAIKIAEDEILYEKVTNWDEIKTMFNKIYPQEFEFNIAKKDLIRWHELLQSYFSKEPKDESVVSFIVAIGLGEVVADEILNLVRVLRTKQEFKNMIMELYDSIDKLLTL